MVTISRVTEASEVQLSDINALLPQVRQGTDIGSENDLRAITSDENVIFLVAKDEGKVIGMATVYVVVKFGKKTGFVEDVVVSEQYRGQGLGKKLMEMSIAEAKRLGITQLNLTSRPDRVAANELYKKLGFTLKETNAYRLKL